ncbi:hypothetical protein FIBSPDRAFT_865526 [Athelia psychrophila]|uniref:Uncharacterized protein n=1 Tax=Athelia psychrophila TaxID=1759441 RepID=A0A166FG76_9AGAM|nr:hypothetical protein FIBSPDRAFT_865526 [Fibularhizoctonia sp. CBS 109695]
MSDDAIATPPLEAQYEDKSGIGYATKVAVQAGGVGLLLAALQRVTGPPLLPAHVGFWSLAGRNSGLFAAMGAAFALTETAVANSREKTDPLNGVAGGCAAGFLAGVRARSLPMAVAGCAAVGAAMGAFDYSGELAGQTSSPEQQEERRKRFFKQPRPAPAE